MIFTLHKNKTLSYHRKTPIYIGEKDFDKIEVFIPDFVEGNSTEELNFFIHLVKNNGEYMKLPLIIENTQNHKVGSIKVAADLTVSVQIFDVYIEMVDLSGNKIGKTNVLQIQVYPLPDEQDRIIPVEEYEQEIDELTDIIQQNTEAMNRINGFVDEEQVEEIINGKGFIAEHQDISGKQDKLSQGESNELVDTDESGVMKRSGYSVTTDESLIDDIEQAKNVIPTAQAIAKVLNNLPSTKGEKGDDGKSAYEIAIDNGFVGSEEDWLLSLKGADGSNGKDGKDGINGKDGVDGSDGADGKSAYQIAVENGYSGTESEWLLSLKGADGAKGDNYVLTEQDKSDIAAEAEGLIDISGKEDVSNKATSVNLTAEITDEDSVKYTSVRTLKNMFRIIRDNMLSQKADKTELVNVIQRAGTNDNTIDDCTNTKVIYEGLLHPSGLDGEYTGYYSVICVGTTSQAKAQYAFGENGKVIYRCSVSGDFSDIGWNNYSASGKSAYEIAVLHGYVGTEEEWLESLKGTDGQQGIAGQDGVDGKDGLNGNNGLDGKSAYEIAVDKGFIGNEAEWLLSLKGANGEKGDAGDDYILTAQDKTDIANIVLQLLPTTQGVLYGNASN